jgi:hypothetical protein
MNRLHSENPIVGHDCMFPVYPDHPVRTTSIDNEVMEVASRINEIANRNGLLPSEVLGLVSNKINGQ